MDVFDVVIGIAVVVALSLLVFGLAGLGSARADSEYTGNVVDVVEDKGMLIRPSWVNMKTDARSSDIQQYCLREDDEQLKQQFYTSMKSGDRVTVSYSRPLWVSPLECDSGHAIVHDIEAVNGTIGGA